MDWKREAIDKLRCYNARKNAIATITQEIRRFTIAMYGVVEI